MRESVINCKKIPDREVKIIYPGINGTQTFPLQSGSIFNIFNKRYNFDCVGSVGTD